MVMYFMLNCKKCNAVGYVNVVRDDIQSDDLDFICDKCDDEEFGR